MNKAALLNTADDMDWLRTTHLANLHGRFKSAVIFGNEDWPKTIHLYVKKDPLVTDHPAVYTPDDDGDFRVRPEDLALTRTAPKGRRAPKRRTRR